MDKLAAYELLLREHPLWTKEAGRDSVIQEKIHNLLNPDDAPRGRDSVIIDKFRGPVKTVKSAVSNRDSAIIKKIKDLNAQLREKKTE